MYGNTTPITSNHTFILPKQPMNTEKTTPELCEALAKAQAEIENATKSSANPFFKSKYADLAEVLNTVRPVFAKHGLAIIQGTSFDGNLVHVETVVTHSSNGMISSVASCVPAKHDAQGVGASTTYLRRYSLAGMTGVAQEDDDGNSASKAPPKKSMINSPTMGAFDSLHPARQSIVVDVAEAVKERFAADDIVGAYEEYNGLTDVEEKTGLWSLLDSKVRSAIKKHGESLKATNVT